MVNDNNKIFLFILLLHGYIPLCSSAKVYKSVQIYVKYSYALNMK